MLISKLPLFFPHRIAEWNSAAISKQTFIWTPSSCSYNLEGQGFAQKKYTVGCLADLRKKFEAWWRIFNCLNLKYYCSCQLRWVKWEKPSFKTPFSLCHQILHEQTNFPRAKIKRKLQEAANSRFGIGKTPETAKK